MSKSHCLIRCPYESRRGKKRGRKADGGGWGQEMQSWVLQIWQLICYPGASLGETVDLGETISERLSCCFQKWSSTNFLMSCGYLLLQLDTLWGFQSCLSLLLPWVPMLNFFILCESLLSHFWFTATAEPCLSARGRGSFLSSTPTWLMCLAPSLRVISLLDSPYYAATLAFSLAFRNTSHMCYRSIKIGPQPQSLC